MSKLNLYKLERTDGVGYEEYDSCVVVVAESEAKASIITPSGHVGSTWSTPEHLTVTKIGVASDDLNEGDVIVASFNAG